MGLINTLLGNSRANAELQLHQDEFAQRKADREHANAVQALDEQRKMRPMLDEAYQRFGGEDGDPKQLNATIEDIFKGYQSATGKAVHPDVIKAFKDPKFGAQLLDASAQSGTTLGQLFEQGTDASMRAMARLSMKKQQDTQASQHAFVAGDSAPPPSPTAIPAVPATGAAPLGQGLQLGGAPQAVPLPGPAPVAPAAPAQSGVSPAPAAVPAAAATGLTPPAAAAPIINGATPPGGPTPALQAAVDQIDTKIANLQKNIGVVVSKGDKTGPLVTALNERLKVLQDQRFQLTSKFALGQVEAQAQADRQPLPRQELSESGAPLGSTYGGARSAAAGGNPLTMLTPQQHAGIASTASAAGTELTDMVHQGTVARQMLPRLEIATAAALKGGVTGPMVTPVREALYNVGNLFGIKTQGQTALQVMNSLTPAFAVQLTSQMKGQQSDREFIAGVNSSANTGQTNQAYAITAYFGRELAKMAIEREVQARRWTADTSHPGLNIPDKYGRTFQDVYDASLQKYYDDNGTIGERASRAFGINYKDVLNGKITPIRGGR